VLRPQIAGGLITQMRDHGGIVAKPQSGTRLHENMVRNLIVNLGTLHPFNSFLTVSFKYRRSHLGHWTPMDVQDIADCYRMMGSFSRYLSDEAYGRCRSGRSKEGGIPLIGIPEYLSRSGEPTYPHYHVVLKCPLDQESQWRRYTREFWAKMAVKHTIAIDVQFKDCYDPVGALDYAMKHSDPGFTIQNMITSGRLH
jgi:hypothetical protein